MIYVPMCWSQLILWQLGQWLMVADSAWSTLQSSAEFCAQIFGAWGTSWRAFHRRVSDRSFDLSLSFRMVDESILSSLFLVRNSWKVWKTSKFDLLFQMFSNNWWKRQVPEILRYISSQGPRLRRTNRRGCQVSSFMVSEGPEAAKKKVVPLQASKCQRDFVCSFLLNDIWDMYGYVGMMIARWCGQIWANLLEWPSQMTPI